MSVQMFDSTEEMFAEMESAMLAADERVTDKQKELEVGDCFIQDTDMGFYIIGEILEEYEEERLRNYKFCNCYSAACRFGELGDVHLSVITSKIPKDWFDYLVSEFTGE